MSKHTCVGHPFKNLVPTEIKLAPDMHWLWNHVTDEVGRQLDTRVAREFPSQDVSMCLTGIRMDRYGKDLQLRLNQTKGLKISSWIAVSGPGIRRFFSALLPKLPRIPESRRLLLIRLFQQATSCSVGGPRPPFPETLREFQSKFATGLPGVFGCLPLAGWLRVSALRESPGV